MSDDPNFNPNIPRNPDGTPAAGPGVRLLTSRTAQGANRRPISGGEGFSTRPKRQGMRGIALVGVDVDHARTYAADLDGCL